MGALDEANYCIWCHNQGKDSCARGLRDRKTGAFQKSAFGVPLTGCPLEEKISEFHLLKTQGKPIAAHLAPDAAVAAVPDDAALRSATADAPQVFLVNGVGRRPQRLRAALVDALRRNRARRLGITADHVLLQLWYEATQSDDARARVTALGQLQKAIAGAEAPRRHEHTGRSGAPIEHVHGGVSQDAVDAVLQRIIGLEADT